MRLHLTLYFTRTGFTASGSIPGNGHFSRPICKLRAPATLPTLSRRTRLFFIPPSIARRTELR
jgi:hypothetical protein